MNQKISDLAALACAVEELLGIVREEYNLLLSKDSEGVAGLVEKKDRLLLSLAHDFRIDELLAPNPEALDESGRNLCRRIREGAREAKEINRLNGIVIACRMRYTQQALDLLLASSSCSPMYNQSGVSSATAIRGTLGRA